MGLFINNDKHPDVYKNNDHIFEKNQLVYKRDHVSELREEQQKANESLQQSFDEMKNLFAKQAQKQAYHWRYFGNRLYELKKVTLKQEKAEGHVMDWLKKLDEQNTKLQLTFEKDQFVKEEFVSSIENLNHSSQEVVKRLDYLGMENEQISLKVNEQLDLQKQMSQQIFTQEEKQNDVLERLDNQEALTEKILRQIDHFRAVLFERTNFLAEKLDTSYNYTASYFTKLMNGNESKTHFINQAKRESEKW
jgi:hypothetical protein